MAFASEITNTDLLSQRPQIHSDGGKIFLVWTEKAETNSEVFFSKSIDEGVNFSVPINLSNNQGHSAFPRMAINGNNIFVTWYDYSPGQSDVMFAKSLDSGETFSTFNISDNISASYNPWIAADSNLVYLVWNDGGKSQEIVIDGKDRIIDVLVGDSDIMFGVSYDKGQTFEIKNISNMPGDSINARMWINGNNTYVTWTHFGNNSEVFFSKSSDSAFTFSDPINISKSDANSFDSGINVYGKNIFMIWEEQKNKGAEIYFSKSSDGGNLFNQPISISGEFGNYIITRDTQIDISYPHLYVVYYDELNSDIYLIHSPDMGETFYDSINLSSSLGDSVLSQIETKENKVFVIWNDNSDGDNDVYLRESSDFGYTFGPKINLSDDQTDSDIFLLGPQVAISDNFINVIWENKTESKSNLILKQKPIENLPLSFSFSDKNIPIILEGYAIQPGEETQIEIKLESLEKDWNFSKNHSLIVLDSKNNTVFQGMSSEVINGSAIHTVIFPMPGQYSLKLNFDDLISPSNNEIIITVVPEFEFGIFLILSASISIVIFTKRIHPKIFR